MHARTVQAVCDGAIVMEHYQGRKVIREQEWRRVAEQLQIGVVLIQQLDTAGALRRWDGPLATSRRQLVKLHSTGTILVSIGPDFAPVPHDSERAPIPPDELSRVGRVAGSRSDSDADAHGFGAPGLCEDNVLQTRHGGPGRHTGEVLGHHEHRRWSGGQGRGGCGTGGASGLDGGHGGGGLVDRRRQNRWSHQRMLNCTCVWWATRWLGSHNGGDMRHCR
mmetsp:Transcript_19743/g.47881  ORF Transcript_19743/g.47881 Transcript_19743/m.47881 type:complete len:221 (-) Transcript_19743:9-671(-)